MRDGVPVIVKMTPDRLATIRRAALRAVRKFACVYVGKGSRLLRS